MKIKGLTYAKTGVLFYDFHIRVGHCFNYPNNIGDFIVQEKHDNISLVSKEETSEVTYNRLLVFKSYLL